MFKGYIDNKINDYTNIWNKYNNKYFISLMEYLNINWPNDKMTIEASIGLIPVFPRYLEIFSLALGDNVSEKDLIMTCAHETLHFLWLEKWKQLYPDCSIIEFDSPYLPWKYSEMVTDPILNDLGIKSRAYDSFYQLENGKVMEELKLIYSKKISVEDKIREGYKYIKSKI